MLHAIHIVKILYNNASKDMETSKDYKKLP